MQLLRLNQEELEFVPHCNHVELQCFTEISKSYVNSNFGGTASHRSYNPRTDSIFKAANFVWLQN